MEMFEKKVILITGGTGSFGKAFTKKILTCHPKKVIIFSRDEFKQFEMEREFNDNRLRFRLGDVRDLSRLKQSFKYVDYVVHAAALKQVPALEYNPTEAVKTNITGSMNVCEAALECGVKKVVALSTDKAVNPINLYGATKLAMEKIFTASNVLGDTKFACVRYGNVIGSRGSVIETYLRLLKDGIKEFPVTDITMTRFWITLEQAVKLVFLAFQWMENGEIYVPQIPSMYITDLAKAICPDCIIKEIGIRRGEKKHECLISEDSNNVYQMDLDDGSCITDKVDTYYSNDNDKWLKSDTLRQYLGLDSVYV